jgi:hypothetical protein
VTLRERYDIARQLRRCVVCGKTAHGDHHRRAKCRGGSEAWWNKAPVCMDCHALFHQYLGQHLAPTVLHAEQKKKSAITLMLKHGLRQYWLMPSFLQRLLPKALRKKAEEA